MRYEPLDLIAVVAVSDTTRYIIVPLIASAVAVIGIVVPLALVARNERIKFSLQSQADQNKLALERAAERQELDRKRLQERTDLIAQAVKATRRDALLLREVATAFALTKTDEAGRIVIGQHELATINAARGRLFKGLYENPELFATLVPTELQSDRRLEKLMLLLGVLESRLRDFGKGSGKLDATSMFGLDFLIRAVDTETLHTDTKDALEELAKRDPEAGAFFDVLLRDV